MAQEATQLEATQLEAQLDATQLEATQLAEAAEKLCDGRQPDSEDEEEEEAAKRARTAWSLPNESLGGSCFNCGARQENCASPTCYTCGTRQDVEDDSEEEEDEDEENEEATGEGDEGKGNSDKGKGKSGKTRCGHASNSGLAPRPSEAMAPDAGSSGSASNGSPGSPVRVCQADETRLEATQLEARPCPCP